MVVKGAFDWPQKNKREAKINKSKINELKDLDTSSSEEEEEEEEAPKKKKPV